MLQRLKFDLEEPANKMLDQLPEHIFKSETTTFYDPAPGGGQFVSAIENRLRQYGHSDKNISKRVFGYVGNRIHLNYIINTHKLVGTYFKTTIEDMKFNVVICNPPYQQSDNVRAKLWNKFVEAGYSHLKEGGYMTMIIPCKWFTQSSNRLSKVINIFTNNNLIRFDLDSSKYFPQVGDIIGTFTLQKSNQVYDTVVIRDGKEYKIRYKGQRIAFTEQEKLTNSILSKVKAPDKSKKINSFASEDLKQIKGNWRKYVADGILSEDKSDEYPIPLHYTASKTLYRKSTTPKWKVFINLSGYYYHSKKPTKYMFTEYSQDSFGGMINIPVDSKEEGDNIISFLHSKTYRFFNDISKAGSGFNTKIAQATMLDKSKSWSDSEIYSYFNLTQEEVNLIESTIE
jgi:hypothetical protein